MAEHSHPNVSNLLMCTHVLTCFIFPIYLHFSKCIFVRQCAPLLRMYICAPMCPISPMCPTFANVYLCPNVTHFYKCIFVPHCAPLLYCAPLLQIFICAPMCPTFTNVYLCPNVPQCAPLLHMCIWTSPNYPRGVERQVTSELVTSKLVIQD